MLNIQDGVLKEVTSQIILKQFRRILVAYLDKIATTALNNCNLVWPVTIHNTAIFPQNRQMDLQYIN